MKRIRAQHLQRRLGTIDGKQRLPSESERLQAPAARVAEGIKYPRPMTEGGKTSSIFTVIVEPARLLTTRDGCEKGHAVLDEGNRAGGRFTDDLYIFRQ